MCYYECVLMLVILSAVAYFIYSLSKIKYEVNMQILDSSWVLALTVRCSCVCSTCIVSFCVAIRRSLESFVIF